MNNGQLDISTIIIAVVSAIIGAILLSVGNKKDKRVLRFLGIGFLVGAGVSLFVKSTELREILTALAIVFAVFIAAFSIDESRRLRQDSFDRDSRDRRERLLNEIIEWATDVVVCALSVPATTMFEDITYGLEETAIEKMVRRDNVTTYTNVRLRYQISARKSKYIEIIASGLSMNLGSAVENLSKQMDNVISELRKCAKDPEDRSKYENLLKAEDLLHEKAYILIEEATRIKTRDMEKEEENMPKEGEATGSNELTLEKIEEHLIQQDKQMTRGSYTTGAAVGAAITLVAVSLWIGRTVLSPDAFYWTYIFLLICGFGFMSWCRYKQHKIKG